MFAHRSEDQQNYNPFLTKQPTSWPSQSKQQGPLAAQEQSWLDTGPREETAAITKSSPEVTKHRAQLLSHWAETPSWAAGTKQAAQRMAPPAAGPDDSFERLTRGAPGEYVSESRAPARLTLPAELTAGMAAAWQKSRPQGHSLEQGGLMVRNQDGSTAWQPGGRSFSGKFDPDWEGVRPEQAVLATGHTHPYDTIDEGHINVPFTTRALRPTITCCITPGDLVF